MRGGITHTVDAGVDQRPPNPVSPPPPPLLAFLQEDARKANTAEVAEEDRKAKLPKNFEAKKAQAEWEEAEAKAKKVRPTPPS